MTNKAHTSVHVTQSPLDAFLAVSRTYLACAEQLTVLNTTTAHQLLEDCACATRQALDVASGAAADDTSPPLTHMIDKTLAYTTTVQEIVSRTQHEVSEMMIREFSEFQERLANPDTWSTAFGLFTMGRGLPLPTRRPAESPSPTRSEMPRGAATPTAHATSPTRKAA